MSRNRRRANGTLAPNSDGSPQFGLQCSTSDSMRSLGAGASEYLTRVDIIGLAVCKGNPPAIPYLGADPSWSQQHPITADF